MIHDDEGADVEPTKGLDTEPFNMIGAEATTVTATSHGTIFAVESTNMTNANVSVALQVTPSTRPNTINTMPKKSLKKSTPGTSAKTKNTTNKEQRSVLNTMDRISSCF